MTASRYPVSVRRLAPCARFEAAGHPEALTAALHAAGLLLPSRANTSALSPGAVQVDWLGPRRFVITAPMADEERLHGQLQGVFAAFPLADVCCTSDMVVHFELAGSGADDILAQGTALDLKDPVFAPGSVTVTDLWGIAAVVARPLQSPACRVVTVDRSLAGFVEAWLLTANGLPTALRPGVMRTARGSETVAQQRSNE